MLDEVEKFLRQRFLSDLSNRSHDETVAMLSAIKENRIELNFRMASLGTFSTICNFQGFRLDLHPNTGEGFVECVLIEEKYLLALARCTLFKGSRSRFQSAPATVIGIRARSEGNFESHRNLFKNDANVIVGSHLDATMKEVQFTAGEKLTFLSFNVPVNDGLQDLKIDLPHLQSEIRRTEAHLKREKRHYVHFFASSYATRTLTDIILCPYEGQLQYEYKKLKLLELLCNVEQICADAEADLTGSIYRYTKNDQRAIEQARRIIETDYMSKLLEDEVARDVGLSRSRLRTFFEKKYGQTIHDFIVSLRVNKALELLEETDLMVNEVAAAVGYSDPSGLRLAFKKYVGTTPRESRRQLKKL